MSTTPNERPRGPSAETVGVRALAVLALWFLAVLVDVSIALNAVVEMTYFELIPIESEELVAARPWVWGSMIGFLVLAALGWWMGSRWWQALLVASTGIAGLQQLQSQDNGPLLAMPFLLVTIIGAIATVITARPFPRPLERRPRA